MKITELIKCLTKILEVEGDLNVWIDTANEVEFGEIKSVVGSDYSGRISNDNPHAFIISDSEFKHDWDE